MEKLKSICKDTLSYIAARRLLRYSIIAIIILLPTGVILTNKYLSSKSYNIEKIEELASNEKDKNKNVATGTIKTDVKDDTNISRHTLGNGYSTLSDKDSSNSSSSSNNSISSNTSNKVDKSSISGINLEILEGHEFNPRKDLNLQATDINGSNISDNIIIEKNNVNTTIPGTYTVKVRVRLSSGISKEKEFTVTVKETRLDVSLESFKTIKTNIKKGEKIGFELDLNVSKKHINPTAVMINGQEYTLYKGNENIIDKLTNTKNYKVFVNANDASGVYKYNLEHVKMSNGAWISLGENVVTLEVLKNEASIKKFYYEEESINKKLKLKFDLEDLENTASNLRLEFYKDDKLLENRKLNKTSNYTMDLDVNSNGIYNLKILGDINLNQNITEDTTIYNKEIFTTSINVSNINQFSLTGENIEIIQGEEFDSVNDLSLKAIDIDGENITNKIVVEDNNIDTNIVGNYTVSVYVISKNGQKYSKQFNVIVKPIAQVIEFNPTKDEVLLNENISFELKLQMEKDNIDADKAIINGEEVKLIPNRLKNILGNIKTYSFDLNGELSEGNKTYSLSKIIMEDGKEFTLEKDTNIKVLKSDITIDSNSKFSLTRMLFDDKKGSKSILKNSNSTNISGNKTEALKHTITINGTVKKADGGLPDGRIEVELPTAMAFSVDAEGDFLSGTYTIKNNSSIAISVYVDSFMDSNPNEGITIKPKEEQLEGLDRSNLHIDLVSNNSYIDLGTVRNKTVKLLDLNPSSMETLKLRGEAGKEENSTVDEKGVSEKFSLVFNIRKKD